MTALTAKQIGLIHTAKVALKLEDESYRAILQKVAGVTSCKDLDAAYMDDVLREFENLGFKPVVRPQVGFRIGMATPQQVNFICALWQEIHGSNDQVALRKWLERFHHVSALNFLTAEKAHKVVGALQKMAKRQKHPYPAY